MFDRIGHDWRADRILADFAKFGVDTSGILQSPNSESSGATALVRRRDGARAITFTRATCPELDPDDIPQSAIANARFLHLNGRHLLASLRACHIARENGVKISFDGGANRYRPSVRPFVEMSDICIVALDFAKHHTAELTLDAMAHNLLSTTRAETVAITDGIRGSWVFHRSGDHFHQPAIPAKNLVDTTGCGDTYHGAFLHALAIGNSLRDAAELASLIASKTCEALGGRSALAGLPLP